MDHNLPSLLLSPSSSAVDTLVSLPSNEYNNPLSREESPRLMRGSTLRDERCYREEIPLSWGGLDSRDGTSRLSRESPATARKGSCTHGARDEAGYLRPGEERPLGAREGCVRRREHCMGEREDQGRQIANCLKGRFVYTSRCDACEKARGDCVTGFKEGLRGKEDCVRVREGCVRGKADCEGKIGDCVREREECVRRRQEDFVRERKEVGECGFHPATANSGAHHYTYAVERVNQQGRDGGTR